MGLFKPFHKLSKSGDYRGRKFEEHLENGLAMRSCISNAVSFFNVFTKKELVCVLHMETIQ